MSKSLFVLFQVLVIVFCICLCFGILGITGKNMQIYNIKLQKLEYKTDSLEQAINNNLINKKDTIMVNVVPQQIKIYQK